MERDLLVYLRAREFAVALNPSARAIWELCEGQLSAGEIAAELGRRHGVAAHLLQPDVDAAIDRLRDAGLLCPVRADPTPPDPVASLLT